MNALRIGLAAAVLLGLALPACALGTDEDASVPLAVEGSGRVVTEARRVTAFRGIAFGAIGDMRVEPGPAAGITVEAEDNIAALIATEVRSGMLEVRFRREGLSVHPTRPIRFIVTVRSLSQIDASGAGSIRATGLEGRRLSVTLSGAGSISLSRLAVSSLEADISGAGSLETDGAAGDQDIRLSGVGSYRAGELAGRSARIHLSGVGSARVSVTDRLDVTLTGLGSVEYYQAPRITSRVTGFGRLRHLGPR